MKTYSDRGTETRQSDATLVERCLEGNPRAWATLVQRYRRLVYSIPIEYGFSSDDADDIFQMVFMIVLRKLGDLRDRTRLSAWLITTTQRECWRFRKRGGPVLEPEAAAASVAAEPAEDRVECWELRQTIREGLSRLDSRCRDLLQALFLDPDEPKPSYAGVSERLGIPVGSIGPTRARCFAKLEALLRELDPGLFA